MGRLSYALQQISQGGVSQTAVRLASRKRIIILAMGREIEQGAGGVPLPITDRAGNSLHGIFVAAAICRQGDRGPLAMAGLVGENSFNLDTLVSPSAEAQCEAVPGKNRLEGFVDVFP